MKKYILIAAAALTTITGCKDPQKDERVVHERDSLVSIIDDRENSVNDFIASFNEVEHNLDQVRQKQHIILMNTSKLDSKMDQKERINTEIKAINDLMDANNKKLKSLNGKLNRTDKKNKELQKTIDLLTSQLNSTYAELSDLNEKLASLNTQVAQLQISVDTLSSQNMAQVQTIDEKTKELHTAYYVVGHSKDLQESNLIDKKGGLLGMGRTSKISDNVDNSKFNRIDYIETTTIPVNSKNMKIITSHPTDSYTIDKSGKTITYIVINDPEKFWSSSKYLVVAN